MEGHKKRPIQWFSRFSITTALRTTKTTSIFIFYTWIWLNRTHNIIALEIPVSRILIQVPHGNAITVITFFTIIDDCSQSVIWIIAWESIWCNRSIITTLMNHSKPCLLQVQWNCKEWDRLLCLIVYYIKLKLMFILCLRVLSNLSKLYVVWWFSLSQLLLEASILLEDLLLSLCAI